MNRLTFCLVMSALSVSFWGCAFPHRPGYDRNIGAYPKSQYNIWIESKHSSPRDSKDSSIPQVENTASLSELKAAIKPWLGTPYLWGGESKRGTDCSGFVRQVFNQVYQFELPHSTKEAWTFGQAIFAADLTPGDIVFFGNYIGVSHNGIYVGNNTFAHASTSKGVMYETLDHPYWAQRYQGARRYIW